MCCPDCEPQLLRLLQYSPDEMLKPHRIPQVALPNVSNPYSRHISRHHMVETSAAVLIRKQFKGNPSTGPLACELCFHLCEWLLGSMLKTPEFQTHEAPDCSNKLSLIKLQTVSLSTREMLTLASLLASWPGLMFFFIETSAIIWEKDKLRCKESNTSKNVLRQVNFCPGRSGIISPCWQISITCAEKYIISTKH